MVGCGVWDGNDRVRAGLLSKLTARASNQNESLLCRKGVVPRLVEELTAGGSMRKAVLVFAAVALVTGVWLIFPRVEAILPGPSAGIPAAIKTAKSIAAIACVRPS